MTRSWRIVLTAVVSVLAAGAVIGCTGLLTGASLPRILNAVFGGAENMRPAVGETLRTLGRYLSDVLASLGL